MAIRTHEEIVIDAGWHVLRRMHAAYESGQIKGYVILWSERYPGAIDTIIKANFPCDAEHARLRFAEAFK